MERKRKERLAVVRREGDQTWCEWTFCGTKLTSTRAFPNGCFHQLYWIEGYADEGFITSVREHLPPNRWSSTGRILKVTSIRYEARRMRSYRNP